MFKICEKFKFKTQIFARFLIPPWLWEGLLLVSFIYIFKCVWTEIVIYTGKRAVSETLLFKTVNRICRLSASLYSFIHKKTWHSKNVLHFCACESMLKQMPMLLAENENLPATDKSDQFLAFGYLFLFFSFFSCWTAACDCSASQPPTDGDNAPFPLKPIWSPAGDK